MERDPIRAAIQRATQNLSNDLGLTPDALRRAIMDGAADIAGVIVTTNDEPEHGPFVFYAASPVEQTPQERGNMIAQAMLADPRLTIEAAAKAIDDYTSDQIYLSTEYQVALRVAETEWDHDVLHLSIKRIDREPIHDWRALQAIKNVIVGEECEAFEIYPAESRLVDSANQYHLWAFVDPNVRVPVGFVHRLVDIAPLGKSVQRPFESIDALWPSKAELASSLRQLSAWMRDNTGPSDGTLDILRDAMRLLNQIDKADEISKNIRETLIPDDLREQIEKFGVARFVEEAKRARWISADDQRNRDRLIELRRIYEDDPSLKSVSDSELFLAEFRALEGWEFEVTNIQWCEPCGSYHHSSAPHINRE